MYKRVYLVERVSTHGVPFATRLFGVTILAGNFREQKTVHIPDLDKEPGRVPNEACLRERFGLTVEVGNE